MSVFDRHKSSSLPAPAVTTETVPDLAQLIACEEWAAALACYRQTRQQDEAVSLAPAWVYPLARQAQAEGLRETALALVEGFSKRYPAHPDVVKNYLLAAAILAERFGEKGKAEALLRRLAERYREHPDRVLIDEKLHLLSDTSD